MAWAGTGKIELFTNQCVKLTFTGLDADNEETYTLFPLDVRMFGFVPSHAQIISTDTQAGLTYDIALQGSVDATNWTDIVTNTAKDTTVESSVDYTGATGDPTPAGYIYYRILAADVTDGVATSHTTTVHLWR